MPWRRAVAELQAIEEETEVSTLWECYDCGALSDVIGFHTCGEPGDQDVSCGTCESMNTGPEGEGPITDAVILGDLPIEQQIDELMLLLSDNVLAPHARVEISGALVTAMGDRIENQNDGVEHIASVVGLDTTDPELLAARIQMLRTWIEGTKNILVPIGRRCPECDDDDEECISARARKALAELEDFDVIVSTAC